MRIDTRSLVTAATVALLSLPGCQSCDSNRNASGSATSASAPPAASATPSASGSAGRPERPPPRLHVMTAGMLLRTARTLDLAAEVRAKVEKIEDGIRVDDPSATSSELKALQADLVDGIRHGKVDLAKVESHHAAVDKEAQDRLDSEAEALAALHAVLSPAQRNEVVTSVRTKIAQRDEAMGADAGSSGDGGPLAGARGGAATRRTRRRMEQLAKQLDLEPDQKKKIEPLVVKHDDTKRFEATRAEMKKSSEALLAAFVQDSFDAKAQVAFKAGSGARSARSWVDHEARLMAEVVPHLTPAQREKLAVQMEAQSRMRGRGGPGGPSGDDTH